MTVSTYRSRVEALEQLADTLADRLRSANAVIQRMQDAQFNPAILDRIREALDEHRAVRQVEEDRCFNCNKPMSEHGPMAECYVVTDSAPSDVTRNAVTRPIGATHSDEAS